MAVGAGTVTSVSCRAAPERDREEIAETGRKAWNVSRLGAQLTLLAKAGRQTKKSKTGGEEF